MDSLKIFLIIVAIWSVVALASMVVIGWHIFMTNRKLKAKREPFRHTRFNE